MGEEQNHSVVITGASRGIGRCVALAFARCTSYNLILLAQTESALAETRDLCRQKGDNNAVIIPGDLSDPDFVQHISLPSNISAPKIIINNAGSFLFKKLQDTALHEIKEQIESNFYTAVNTVNRFLGDIKKSRGLIVNICSVGSVEGLKDSGAYSASKHALLGYTRSLRRELLGTEVAITAINLGQTQSTSWEESDIDAERLIDPGDIAKIIINLTDLSPRTVVEEILIKPTNGRVPPM